MYNIWFWFMCLLLSSLGCRSALQLITPVGPVETSVTPAEILAICSPQLGPTLAAVYKLVVVEGWLHRTSGPEAVSGAELTRIVKEAVLCVSIWVVIEKFFGALTLGAKHRFGEVWLFHLCEVAWRLTNV